MSKIEPLIFVSAVYSIYKNKYAIEVWRRVEFLSTLVPVHLFCNAADAERARKLPGVTVHIKEFEDLETYQMLKDVKGLPDNRKSEKDTKEFMILMNAKTEFIKNIKDIFPAEHYVWIDGVIVKIFKAPVFTIRNMHKNLQKQLRDNAILIPGCHDWSPASDLHFLANRVSWRFCGGFFVVPYKLVDPFYRQVKEGCEELSKMTGKATWEVNVWVFIENKLPIQWAYGNHDESIFSCIDSYYA